MYGGTNTIHASFNWNSTYDSYTHVASWGNDTTGDGTKKYPYRTLTKALQIGSNIVVGSMTIREIFTGTLHTTTNVIVGDGNVIIDVTNGTFYGGSAIFTFINITLRGSGSSSFIPGGVGGSALLTNCTFDGAMYAPYGISYTTFTNCTIKNITAAYSIGAGTATLTYTTFYNCSHISTAIPLTKCIISTCTFDSLGLQSVTYCDFYNTYIKFNGTGTSTNYTTFSAFSAAYVTAGGTAANLIALYFIDPQFNNPTIGDLTLAIASPAKNLSYYGDIIGAQNIGISLVANTNAATSAFDNSSLVNMTIDGTTGALTMTDTSQNSQATSKPFANLAGRYIAGLMTYGFNSDRNGEFIDATSDVDLTGTYAAGDTLTTDRIYIVDGSGGSINYNGTAYAVGDRFTCKSAASTFSNVSVAGYVREIIEGPTRNNVEARFSNGTGTFKNNGDTLTSGYWYYLSAGTATLSSVAYTAGQFIKGDGTAVSSSGATIEEVFTTDAYQYYECVGALTCNRSGNVFTGAITKGNGDPSFDRTTANVFKINSKYGQTRYTIQSNNLTP